MINQEQKNIVHKFLSGHPIAVVATADLQGNPAAAAVLFATTDDLELVFSTHPTRKYQNLQANPKVALVVSKGMVAVQYHGHVAELAGQALEQYSKVFLAKHPQAGKQLPTDTKFIRVTPQWIRYTDLGKRPAEIFEFTLSAGD